MQKICKLGTNVSLVFWNIDNVHYRLDNQRYCKLTEPEVISHLTKHDIICLTETHSGPSDKIELDGYSLVSNIRPKNPKATKYFGGLAVYIKHNIKQGITFMPITNSEYMWFKLDKHFFNLQADLYISLIYVCPASSTFANKRDDIFELIENDIANFSKMGNCLLCGDFNARTNKNPDFCTNDDISEQVDLPFHYVQDTEIPRQNIDNAKVDMQGKALLNLCKASGLRIVNGRFLGDRIGFYTCFNYKGAPSVIDYMICSQALLDHIQSFHVSDPNTASIHCSLSLHL
jgi:exonuclease III